MVFFAVSYNGKLPSIFIPPGDTVNSEYYQNNILIPSIAAANRLYNGINWIWQQDSAPAHSSRSTQQFLMSHVPDFITNTQWPPNSSDIALMDFAIFGPLKEKVSAHKSQSIDQLRQHILYEWNRFPQHHITKAIDSWTARLRNVVNVQGNHIYGIYSFLWILQLSKLSTGDLILTLICAHVFNQ